MPLPIGHALAGATFFQARPGFFFRNRWLDGLFFIFLANLPDADFLPGFLAGSPNRYHHGVFHSLGAALAVAAFTGAVFLKFKKTFWRHAAMVFLVLLSHLLLDYFTRDLAAPYGLPLFWPLSGAYHFAPSPFFINITRSAASSDFFLSLFSAHNLKAALLEVGLLGGLVLLVTMAMRLARKEAK
jgi:membrane-bound metal-dependent hydrolase YbcI (DUF457 family)